MVKTVFSTCGSWIFAASKMPEKKHWIIFSLHYKNSFGLHFKKKFLSFLKQAGCLALLAGKSSEVLFHWIGLTTVMTLNNHKTLYAAHFSHGTVHCVLGLSLHNSETARKHVFVNLAIGTCWQRTIFPLWNLDSSVSNLPKIHTHLFSSSLKQQLWSSFWIFWKQQDACCFL